jgi:hypothetical protein
VNNEGFKPRLIPCPLPHHVGAPKHDCREHEKFEIYPPKEIVLICPICKSENHEWVSVLGCSKCNPMSLYNVKAAQGAPGTREAQTEYGKVCYAEGRYLDLILHLVAVLRLCVETEPLRGTLDDISSAAKRLAQPGAPTKETTK